MNLLITGSTGFIGRRLTRTLSLAGHSLKLLVRRSSLNKAHELFHDLPELQLIEADVTRIDELTQVANSNAGLENLTAIIHLAGAYHLDIGSKEAYTQNILGTQNMVYFAKMFPKLPAFHHVSSYAVNSRGQGSVGEDQLDSTAKLSDHYAQSKLQAESIVRQTDWQETKLRIYRPGIIVGDSCTGQMDKIDGPYYFLQLFYRMKMHEHFTRYLPFFLLAGRPGAEVPLLPVDVLVKWLEHMITKPTSHQRRSYHLVSPEPIQAEHFVRESLRLMGLPMAVRRLPETRLLNPILPRLGIPKEVAPYLYSTATFSRDHLSEDYPDLDSPLLENYHAKIVEGARELFAKK